MKKGFMKLPIQGLQEVHWGFLGAFLSKFKKDF